MLRLFSLLFTGIALQAAVITSSTATQTTCRWIGDPPGRSDVVIQGTGSAACPAGYRGNEARAAVQPLPAGIDAYASVGALGIISATSTALGTYQDSIASPVDGTLALIFTEIWTFSQDLGTAELLTTFFFNGETIGTFRPIAPQVGGIQDQRTFAFNEPLSAGQTYVFGATIQAKAIGLDSSLAEARLTVSAIDPPAATVPEPATGICVLAGLIAWSRRLRQPSPRKY